MAQKPYIRWSLGPKASKYDPKNPKTHKPQTLKGGAPLAAASRQTAYIEAMCDTIGAAIQQTAVSRVRIIADRNTLSAIEPIPTWLLSVGFLLGDDGVCSPED